MGHSAAAGRPSLGDVPRYLLRGRGRIFAADFVQQVKAIGI